MARRTAPTIERPTLDYLAHWGPNRVAVGDLGIAGMPGLIYTPSAGHDLPAVSGPHLVIEVPPTRRPRRDG